MANSVAYAVPSSCEAALDLFAAKRLKGLEDEIVFLQAVIATQSWKDRAKLAAGFAFGKSGVDPTAAKAAEDFMAALEAGGGKGFERFTSAATKVFDAYLISNISSVKYELAEMAVEQIHRVADAVQAAADSFDAVLAANKDALKGLPAAGAAGVIGGSADLNHAAARAGALANLIEDGMESGKMPSLSILEGKLAEITAIVCGEAGENTQRYVESVAAYFNILKAFNDSIAAIQTANDAVAAAQFHICRMNDMEQSMGQFERYLNLTEDYLRGLAIELRGIQGEIQEAAKRQDPLAFGRMHYQWCARLDSLLAVLDSLLRAPLHDSDPVKAAVLKGMCKLSGKIPSLPIRRLELEYGNFAKSAAILLSGAAVNLDANALRGAVRSFAEAARNWKDLMPTGTFKVSNLTRMGLENLLASGMDIAYDMLKIGNIEGYLNNATSKLSSAMSVLGCAASLGGNTKLSSLAGRAASVQGILGNMTPAALRAKAVTLVQEDIQKLKSAKAVPQSGQGGPA